MTELLSNAVDDVGLMPTFPRHGMEPKDHNNRVPVFCEWCYLGLGK